MLAIQTLYEQHAPKVFRFAYGLCGDAHLANDLVAETFVRAMLSSAPIVTETVHAYLFTIARRLYLKEWHRRQRHSELEDVYCDMAPGPEEQASASAVCQDGARRSNACHARSWKCLRQRRANRDQACEVAT
jgi:RNA polymerase sigma-70 factor (ECF subfamily)